MSEKRRGWKWWQKLALAGGLVLVILVAALMSFRQPWVEPVPGVRTEPTRPFVHESDLGPDSAYKLLLEALRIPATVSPLGTGNPVWRTNWTDAITKLDRYSWPQEPPPPARRTRKDDEGDGVLGPIDLGTTIPRQDPVLAPDAPWTREQYEEILQRLKAYAPQMALLDQALAAPNPQVPTADGPDFLLPYLSEAREMTRWLAIQIRYKAASGDYDGAVRDVERLLGMAAIVSRGGVIISHLVTIACEAIGCDAARAIVLKYDLPAPLLKRMATMFLQHADEAEPFVEAVRSESVHARAIAGILYQEGYRSLMRRFGGGGKYPKVTGRVWEVVMALGPLVGSTREATERNFDACYQHMVAAAEKPNAPGVGAEYEDFARDLGGKAHSLPQVLFGYRDPVGMVVATMFMPSLGTAHQKVAYRDAMLRAMALFCAIKAYEKEQGKLPERLDRLVPDYLPRVPIDPFGEGKPFHYLKSSVPNLPPDAWGIYSNGSDFKDDGGNAKSAGNPRAGRTYNPDLVWPSQDYPAP
jgi:hypothetical protein